MADLSSFIKTIIIVMMENRSFDHLLGSLRLAGPGQRMDVDGLTSPGDPAYDNPHAGSSNFPFEAPPGPLATDLPHERDQVRVQLAASAAAGVPTMRGFVASYAAANPQNRPANPPPMGYATGRTAPVSQFLAREYLLCDRWFSPLPTSTQPNRLMAYSGFSRLETTRSLLLPEQKTFADWADAHHVLWRSYHMGFSFLGLFGSMLARLVVPKHFRDLGRLGADLADLGTPFPGIVWVEPAYEDARAVNGSVPACDNHPPLGIEPGEQFLRDVYETVRQSPRWRETLLIVTYDEHGGFFDHVPPPPVRTTAPEGARYPAFETLGVRVPSILISPHVTPGGVFGSSSSGSEKRLDHTSILQLFADCFAGGTDYTDVVAARKVSAGLASLSDALRRDARATPPPPAPPLPRAMSPARLRSLAAARAALPGLSANSQAFMTAARELARIQGPALGKTHPAVAAWVREHDAVTRVAIERITTPPPATRRRAEAAGGPARKRKTQKRHGTRKKRRTQQRRPKS